MRHLSWVAVIALLAAACGGGEQAAPSTAGTEATTTTSRPATTTTVVPVTAAVETYQGVDPGTVFSWAYDLSLWVTKDEMTALFQDLSERYGYGDNLAGSAVLARPGYDLIWSVGSWSVSVHAGGGYHPAPDTTDPRLPDGVTYWAASPSYVFSGPNSPTAICITVITPGMTLNSEGEPDYQGEPDYESVMFDIGVMMLEEMRWLD